MFIAAAVTVLWVTGAATAHAAEPWWQVLNGSRPSHLWEADPAEVQELTTGEADFEILGRALVARVQLGEETVACLGTGEFLFESADAICLEKTGLHATGTAAGLAVALEAEEAYDGAVQVSGPESIGEGTHEVTTTGRWVTRPLSLTALTKETSEGKYTLGSASAEILSEGSGTLNLTLTNLGDAPVDGSTEPVVIEDSLPAGIAAYGVFDPVAGAQGHLGSPECELPDTRHLRCTYEGSLPSYEAIEIDLLVALEGSPPAPLPPGTVSVSGGHASPQSVSQPLEVSPEPVPYGAERFAAGAEEEGGSPAAQAGAHPFQVTNTIQWSAGRLFSKSDRGSFPPDRHNADIEQPALPRNSAVTFPAGLVGSAVAVPTCPMAVFLHREERFLNECPASTAVGVASVTVIESSNFGFLRLAVPIFNLPPGHGEPARFGFMPAGTPVVIDTSVDPEDEYRVTGEVRNATQIAKVLSATIVLWGVPGDPRHDSSRGWECAYYTFPAGSCAPPQSREETPFLRLPVSCAGPLGFEAATEPWNVPLGAAIARAGAQSQPLRGCNRVPFDPALSNALTSKLASNPSGLDLGIEMPGKGLDNPAEGAVSEAQFKRAEIAFPEGVTVNPSIAEGLAVCSEAAYERERYDSAPGEGCPQASKIGSVRIATPLLSEQAEGAVYQATPYENKTGSLIGLYLVAKIPDRGILVKQPIEVRPDPETGQIVSIATDVPQLPFSSFEFHFREGGRSPLITPPGCGSFDTVAKFTPWSAQDPDNPDPSEVVERRASFTVERGVTGGACPSAPAPFHPGFEAGTLNNQAGSYSPFLMHLTRGDGEQDMGKFSFTLPPGVLGKLAGIPYCPEAGIARAQSRQGAHGGQEERDSPSCPAASQIGTTLGGAGVGNQLTYVGGRLYLAGPWHGDPLSVVAITPAVAGPFDAGTVVVREALRLNPLSARAEVDGAVSDPIPHILKGIPLNLRDLRVYADRPEFTLNATSCEPFAAESTIWGDGTALEPLGQTPAALSSRYQAAGCASLGFKPKLAIKLKGGTRRGGHPALKAIVTPRAGDANFAGAVVTLPHSAFLDQAHIRTICTRVQFAAGAGNGAECPEGAVYGKARAWSPLLDEPLSGPVFLRSSSHNLPDLVLALHGLVDIDLAARIDSVNGGIRSSFEGIPDAPVSRFILEMQGGKKGLIVNSTDLCAAKHRARVNATGQNGRREVLRPVMRALGCGKAQRPKHKGHRSHASRAGRGGESR